MNDTPETMKNYHEKLQQALDDDFLRAALDKFAVAYRGNRVSVFQGIDTKELIAKVAAIKDNALKQLPELYAKFKEEAEKRGVHVHYANTPEEANQIVLDIAHENNCKVIAKSKSMTAEETHLNHSLEADGLEVVETDLGEWIIQLRHEGPSHMVMPAIHLSRYQVADLFSDVTKEKQDSDVQKLVKVARRELRAEYMRADMGISGANFAVAETGALAMLTNEGNLRLVTTMPKVHVALCGIEKLIPTIDEALVAMQILPRNATAQHLTAYVTWIAGANECAAGPEGRKIMHVIFLDNGRTALAADPLFSEVLRCVRCGACANVCPVYRLVGGHKMGYVYIGAIGLILTYFFHGRDKARNLIQNCVGCEACKDVCAAGIDLPRLIRELRNRLAMEDGAPMEAKLLGMVMKNRTMFHSLLKFAKYAQRPITGGTQYLRHLPHMFMGDQGFRALPAIASKSFREKWPSIKPEVKNPRFRIALFAGCAQDFMYPDQLESAVRLLSAHNVDIDFPVGQTCCGLPLEMMGQRQVSLDVARTNLEAFGVDKDLNKYDAIVTLCASCAGHLKNSYPDLLTSEEDKQKVAAFSSKIMDFSSFVYDKLGLRADDFVKSSEKVTYHAPCHLCRNLGVTVAPHELLQAAAEYCPSQEEDVCCGFGGTFSLKFPELSAELLKKKLANAQESGASRLVTDCPGCVIQIRGGAESNGVNLKVTHIADLLAENMKK